MKKWICLDESDWEFILKHLRHDPIGGSPTQALTRASLLAQQIKMDMQFPKAEEEPTVIEVTEPNVVPMPSKEPDAAEVRGFKRAEW